ncbi:MAG: hypothetical protein QNJ51_30280 [Calothrix sp. MO_167.B12]|nr:hypothetical protein [Calothrix sp. MO_167.B12]
MKNSEFRIKSSGYKWNKQVNRMTRLSGDTGTRSGMCPVPRVWGGKPQGFESPIKICDLMAPDWWVVQAPTTSVSGASPRLPVSS